MPGLVALETLGSKIALCDTEPTQFLERAVVGGAVVGGTITEVHSRSGSHIMTHGQSTLFLPVISNQQKILQKKEKKRGNSHIQERRY